MTQDVFLTDVIHAKLKSMAKEFNVEMEALGNTLLVLAMCNNEQVKQCINLIKTWDIRGAEKMNQRGM
jgi:hypothetical protein